MKTSSAQISLLRDHSAHLCGLGILHGSYEELKLHINGLHSNESEKYQSLKHERRKSSYLLGRISAKKAIQALTATDRPNEIFIDAGVFDFPLVRSEFLRNVQVSITHAGDYGLSVAFHEDHPMGIDLEEINPKATSALLTQLTDYEIDMARDLFSSDDTGFTLIWTVKEALSKILRTGLMTNFSLLKLEQITKKGKIWESTFKHCVQYKAISYFHGNYACSIVLPKNSDFQSEKLIKLFQEFE